MYGPGGGGRTVRVGGGDGGTFDAKYFNFSPHPPLFDLSPLLFISKKFAVMIKKYTS